MCIAHAFPFRRATDVSVGLALSPGAGPSDCASTEAAARETIKSDSILVTAKVRGNQRERR